MSPDYGALSGTLALAEQLRIDRIMDALQASQEVPRLAQDNAMLRHSCEMLRTGCDQLYTVGKQIEAASEQKSAEIVRLREENARLRQDLAQAEATRDAQAAELKQASEWLQKLIFDA